MTADLRRLGEVLQHELRDGAADTAVSGGLDELLRVQARDEAPGSALLRMIAALPPLGYASLSSEDRERWLRRAIATVRRELTLEEELRPVAESQAASAAAKSVKASSSKKEASSGTSRTRSTAAAKVAPGAAGLDLPIEDARTRLGSANLTRLKKLGIETVRDALEHYPYRHHDFSRTVPISGLRVGVEQTVRGTVDRSREVRMGRGGRMRASEVQITDDLGSRISATWFNQPFIAKNIPAGAELALSGKVTIFRGRPQFQNPEYEVLGRGDAQHTGRMVPVYHLTQGLPQRTLRGVISTLLDTFADRIEDPLPAAIRERHHLLHLADATRQVHYPDSEEQLQQARRRLAFDELLAIQIGVQARRREWREGGDAPVVIDHAIADGFLDTFEFTLTGAQQRVLHELRSDLARTWPMSRLLEGDVGSGKTVVALGAMLSLVAAGFQAVLMAPTEVLAEQHYRTLCRLLSGEAEPPLHGLVSIPGMPMPVRIVLLTGSTRAKERREALQAIRFGGAKIIVGTHALIQDQVEYHRLGMAVVDEQHRFGVVQRGALRRKGLESAAARSEGRPITPHLLVMSATPIPRSLALTAYGDLDLSVIDEMPPGRTPIETRWLTPDRRGEAFEHVRREIAAGRQAFVICPLVEGSETVESRAATEEFERLRTEEFPELADRIVMVHGRMSSKEKDQVMRAFAAGQDDPNGAAILVSTAVVEVGIDIPNATVMVIEGADRFGLAQLHQFRGRVGRGQHASYCYLLADDPSAEAEERLSVMERTQDGFELAEADLELRGPGDLFGTAQSGLPNLRVASLLDAPLIDAARREAEALLDDDPDLARPEHHALRYAVLKRSAEVSGEVH